MCRQEGSVCESSDGGVQDGGMLRFVLQQGSIAQLWDGRHCGRAQEGKSALDIVVGWLVVCDSGDAIAAVLRNFGTAAGGVC
jgi:hypothetical protein